MLQAGFQASDTMQVLGATLGGEGRELSQLESQRQAAAVQKSRRISLLPVGLKLKSRLAATVLTPMAGWGQWICGRFPSQSECSPFSISTTCSPKPKIFQKDVLARSSKRFLALATPVICVSILFIEDLAGVILVAPLSIQDRVQVQWSPTFVRALAAQLRPLGWTATTSGFQEGVR